MKCLLGNSCFPLERELEVGKVIFDEIVIKFTNFTDFSTEPTPIDRFAERKDETFYVQK